MNRAPVDIEWIVAEVLRRLGQRSALPSPPVGPRVAESGVPAGTVPGVQSGTAPAGKTMSRIAVPPADPGTVCIDTRLVTLATLEGRLASVHRVLVVPGAVVTPAVKDELRTRGIRLEVQPRDLADVCPGGVQVIRCLESAAAVQLAAALLDGADVPVWDRSDLADAIGWVAEAVADSGTVCILFTEQPLAAVCLANRRAAIRAAAGITGTEAARAVAQIAANLLVVDPRQVSGVEWQQIVRQFGQDLPRVGPTGWKDK